MGLDYGCLVAFSSTVHDTDNGQDYTEEGMNGLPPRVSIADSFKSPEYRILIVSNKFQTGFDEPLLQTMYVDKRLDGLQCVQSLSRLNRVATGKTDALVLDFVNEPDQVREAFQGYYQTTTLAEETDPNRLYDLQSQLEGFDLYDADTIDQFCRIFYESSRPDELLQGILDCVVEKWSGLEMNETGRIPLYLAELHPSLRIHLTVDYLHRCDVGKVVHLWAQSEQETAETGSPRPARSSRICGLGFVSHTENA